MKPINITLALLIVITLNCYGQKDVVSDEIWNNIRPGQWVPFKSTLNYKTTTLLPKAEKEVLIFIKLKSSEKGEYYHYVLAKYDSKNEVFYFKPDHFKNDEVLKYIAWQKLFPPKY